MTKVCGWDENGPYERDATPEEEAEILALQNQPVDMNKHNAPILIQLEMIDAKSIRALREGNADRITELEQQAASLRLQLIK